MTRYSTFLAGVGLLFLLSACAGQSVFRSPNATGYYLSKAEQCVPYAREQSGVEIYGDAYSWWDKASPRYKRGSRPEVGAVLVLARTKSLPHGHVAVVTDIFSARQIAVTHSNWGNNRKNRRIAYEFMRVEDISPANDWTRLRFWNHEANCFGLPYAAKGFIYRN